MSEYQYYEFRAIDKPLNQRQMAELRGFSTRAEITSTSFTNEYHFGNFRGNPRAMMEKYFDAFLYFANWGTHQLMFRLPRKLVDVKAMKQYCVQDTLSLRAKGDYVVVEFEANSDAPDWDEVEADLADLLPIRDDLLNGDLRSLYLGWLAHVPESDSDDAREPPVPPGLRRLSGSLKAMVDFLYLDPKLVAIAAATDAGSAPEAPGRESMAKWLRSLPQKNKDAILLDVMEGKEGNLKRRLLTDFLASQKSPGGRAKKKQPPRRTIGELLAEWEKRMGRGERE